MQTISLIASILSPLIVAIISYLSLRQARKILKRDIAVPLYQKQIEAFSVILHEAQVLVNKLSLDHRLPGYRESDLNAFIAELQRVQFLFPVQVVERLREFLITCETSSDSLKMRDRLKKLIDEIRDFLDIKALSENIISLEWRSSAPKAKAPPRSSSSGHGGS